VIYIYTETEVILFRLIAFTVKVNHSLFGPEMRFLLRLALSRMDRVDC